MIRKYTIPLIDNPNVLLYFIINQTFYGSLILMQVKVAGLHKIVL